MESDLFSFQWGKHTGGYRISEIEEPTGSTIFTGSKIQIISGKGIKKKWYLPLEENNLHRTFVDMASSPEGVLAFVNKFGFLAFPEDLAVSAEKEGKEYYEEIDLILNARSKLQKVISFLEDCYIVRRSLKQDIEEMTEEDQAINKYNPNRLNQVGAYYFNEMASGHNMQRMKVMLAPTANKKGLTWKVVPQTLLSAMWLMAAEEIIGGVDKGARLNRRCVVCNKRIRSDANLNKITCSDLCRKKRSLLKNKK